MALQIVVLTSMLLTFSSTAFPIRHDASFKSTHEKFVNDSPSNAVETTAEKMRGIFEDSTSIRRNHNQGLTHSYSENRVGSDATNVLQPGPHATISADAIWTFVAKPLMTGMKNLIGRMNRIYNNTPRIDPTPSAVPLEPVSMKHLLPGPTLLLSSMTEPFLEASMSDYDDFEYVASTESPKNALGPRLQLTGEPTDDVWVRDYSYGTKAEPSSALPRRHTPFSVPSSLLTKGWPDKPETWVANGDVLSEPAGKEYWRVAPEPTAAASPTNMPNGHFFFGPPPGQSQQPKDYSKIPIPVMLR